MKNISIKSSEIFKNDDIRADVNYWVHKVNKPNFPKFSDFFIIKDPIVPDFNDIENDFQYCEIGNVDKNGFIYPVELSTDEITNLESDDSKLYKKIFKINKDNSIICKDIMSVKKGDILIPKTRPLLNKVIYIDDNELLDKTKVYYTKAFIRVNVKDDTINPIFGYYIIKYLLNDQLVGVSRIGKSGYPCLDILDINNVIIPISEDTLKDSRINEKFSSLYYDFISNWNTYNSKFENLINEIISKINSLS